MIYDKRTARQQARLAGQLQQIAWAAPQVIMQRSMRMAMAGASPSARDKREFIQMWAEKPAAFGQAWWDMLQESMLLQQRWALQAMQLWSPWLFSGAPLSQAQLNGLLESWTRQHAQAGLKISNKGLSPVRKRAVSNAKRLNASR